MSELSYASPGIINRQVFHSKSTIQEFKPPLEFCNLKETHTSTTDTFLVHLEDPHLNFSGQDNLSKVLDRVIKEYKINLILVEGGTKDDTLSDLKRLASENTWKRVARKFLLEGKIQGEEYLNLTSSHPIKILGIEDKELYLESLKAYKELAEKREAILEYLNLIQGSLNKLKNKLYPKELLEYEKLKGNNIELKIKKLFVLSSPQSFESLPAKRDADAPNGHAWIPTFSPEDGPAVVVAATKMTSLQNLRSLQEKEKQIDFNFANLELVSLIEELKPNCKTQQYRDLILRFRGLRDNKPSQYAYFQNTLNMAKRENINLSKYSNLVLYTDYLKEYMTINPDQLLQEMELLETEMYKTVLGSDYLNKSAATGAINAMAQNHPGLDSQQTKEEVAVGDVDSRLLIHTIDRYLKLLKTAYSMQMSTKEFRIFQLNELDFSTFSYLAFVNKKLCEIGYFEDLLPYKDLLENGKEALIKFYDSVEKRDLAFIHNTQDILKKENKKSAILISGGYHTSHLKELYKKNNYSFVILTPLVTAPTNQQRYEQILLEPLKQKTKKEDDLFLRDGLETIEKNHDKIRPMALKESGARLGEVLREVRGFVGDGLSRAKGERPSDTSPISSVQRARSAFTGARLAQENGPRGGREKKQGWTQRGKGNRGENDGRIFNRPIQIIVGSAVLILIVGLVTNGYKSFFGSTSQNNTNVQGPSNVTQPISTIKPDSNLLSRPLQRPDMFRSNRAGQYTEPPQPESQNDKEVKREKLKTIFSNYQELINPLRITEEGGKVEALEDAIDRLVSQAIREGSPDPEFATDEEIRAWLESISTEDVQRPAGMELPDPRVFENISPTNTPLFLPDNLLDPDGQPFVDLDLLDILKELNDGGRSDNTNSPFQNVPPSGNQNPPDGARLSGNLPAKLTSPHRTLRVSQEEPIEPFRITFGVRPAQGLITSPEFLRQEITPEFILMIARAFVQNSTLFKGGYLIPFNVGKTNTAIRIEGPKDSFSLNFYAFNQRTQKEERIGSIILTPGLLNDAKQINRVISERTIQRKVVPVLSAFGERQRLFRLVQKAWVSNETAVLVKIVVNERSRNHPQLLSEIEAVRAFLADRYDQNVFIELVSEDGAAILERFYEGSLPMGHSTTLIGLPNDTILSYAQQNGFGFVSVENIVPNSRQEHNVIPFTPTILASVLVQRADTLLGYDNLTMLLNNLIGLEFRTATDQESIFKSMKSVHIVNTTYYLKYRIKAIARLNLNKLLEYTKLVVRAIGSAA